MQPEGSCQNLCPPPEQNIRRGVWCNFDPLPVFRALTTILRLLPPVGPDAVLTQTPHCTCPRQRCPLPARSGHRRHIAHAHGSGAPSRPVQDTDATLHMPTAAVPPPSPFRTQRHIAHAHGSGAPSRPVQDTTPHCTCPRQRCPLPARSGHDATLHMPTAAVPPPGPFRTQRPIAHAHGSGAPSWPVQDTTPHCTCSRQRCPLPARSGHDAPSHAPRFTS